MSGTFMTADQHLAAVENFRRRIAELDDMVKDLRAACSQKQEIIDAGENIRKQDADRIAELEQQLAAEGSEMNKCICGVTDEVHHPNCPAGKPDYRDNRIAELERENKRLDDHAKKWGLKAQRAQADAERLLVLVTKWCDKDHHDWQEILKMGEKS